MVVACVVLVVLESGDGGGGAFWCLKQLRPMRASMSISTQLAACSRNLHVSVWHRVGPGLKAGTPKATFLA